MAQEERCRGATVAITLATALQAFDTTVANVALPQIERSLHADPRAGSWIVTAYLVAMAVMTPLTGWLRRRLGARLAMGLAIGGFLAASLLCAIAWSLPSMIAFRLLQGVAAGIIQPLSLALLQDIHPAERHGRVMANWLAVVMIGPVVGPIMGGLLTDYVSWRWIFYANLPLSAAALAGVWRTLRGLDAPRPAPVDLAGFALLALGMGGLELTLERGVGRDWLAAPDVLAAAGVAALALPALAWHVRRAPFPIVRLGILCDRNLAAAWTVLFVVCAGLMATIMLVPALVQGPLARSATLGGALILPRGVATLVATLALGRVVDRLNQRNLLGLGLASICAGFATMALVGEAHGLSLLAAGSLVQGLGTGMVFAAINPLAFRFVPPASRADAAGLFSLGRIVGAASGAALMTAFLSTSAASFYAALLVGGCPTGACATGDLLRQAALAANVESFGLLTLVTACVLPLVLLFRVGARAPHGARVPLD